MSICNRACFNCVYEDCIQTLSDVTNQQIYASRNKKPEHYKNYLKQYEIDNRERRNAYRIEHRKYLREHEPERYEQMLQRRRDNYKRKKELVCQN